MKALRRRQHLPANVRAAESMRSATVEGAEEEEDAAEAEEEATLTRRMLCGTANL